MDEFDSYLVAPEPGRDPARYPANFVRYPAWLAPLRWADRLSRALRGKPAPRLGEALVEGFDRVGPLDPRWGTAAQLDVVREALRLYARRIDDTPHLSATGRFLLRTMALANLKVRASVIAHYEANRAFIEARGRYVRPLIIMGFPRTGTTLLHRLLSEDQNARAPFTFELEQPLPPLESGADPHADPRIAAASANLDTFAKLAPGFLEKFAESHLWSPTEPEELLPYAQFHQGHTLMNSLSAGRPYVRALFAPAFADALFAYERNFVTLLDAYRPARSHWVNKSPVYCPYFAKLFDHYPDARVVITHRHPATNVASVCRMLESWMVPFGEDGSFDKHRHGALVLDELACWFERPLAAREAQPEREGQVIDCLYTELFADPIAIVKRIYAKFELDYSEVFEERMRAYLAANKQGKYGRHKYSNAEYGLEPEQLQDRLRGYYARYGYGLHDPSRA